MPRNLPPQPDTARSIVYALGANLAIAVCKGLGAMFTGSGALLAEAFHSLADTGNECLLLLGRRQAKAPASSHHPLGHGRATYFWAFVVALLLFVVGGVFSIYEGVSKLYAPRPLEAPWLAVAIVLFAMLAEGISLRMALKQIDTVRGNRSLWNWFHVTRRSELIIVLGEDLAAIVGLTLALAALMGTIITDNAVYDAAGSIAVGALLMIVATGLGIEIKSLLIGESAPPRTRRAIRQFLKTWPGIVEVENLITMQLGDDLVIAIRARMNTEASADELVRMIAECKAALRAAFPTATWIFFEPAESTSGGGRRARGKLKSRMRRAQPRAG